MVMSVRWLYWQGKVEFGVLMLDREFEMQSKGVVLVGSLDRWEKKPKAARWFLEGV